MTAPHDQSTLTDAIAHFASGVAAVDAALVGVTDEELDRRPAADAWTTREIVHHLADSETNSYLRLRHLLATPGYVVQPYDQDRWVATQVPDHPHQHADQIVRARRGEV